MRRSKDLVSYRRRSRDQKELNSSDSPLTPHIRFVYKGNSSLLKLSEGEKTVTQGVSKPTGAGILYLLLPAGVRSHSSLQPSTPWGFLVPHPRQGRRTLVTPPQGIRYLHPILTTSRFQLCLGLFFFFPRISGARWLLIISRS